MNDIAAHEDVQITSTSSNPPNGASRRPHQELFGIVERKESSFWTRIGTAFKNNDGSWNLLFDYMPLGSEVTLQMREPRPRDESVRPE